MEVNKDGKIDSIVESIIREKYPELADEWIYDIKKILLRTKFIPSVKEFIEKNPDSETALLTITHSINAEIKKEFE